MILEDLRIELNRYGPNKGKHTGTAKFSGEAGDVTLRLTPDLCDKMFAICAEGVLTTAKEAANNLTCNILDHQKALEERA